jgi:hypothetical protein
MIRIGNAKYVSNHDAQSGVVERGVTKGIGASGAYRRKTRDPRYARAASASVLLRRIVCRI